MNNDDVTIIAIVVIITSSIMVLVSPIEPWEKSVSNPTLTVVGEFDRVELVDRHYGNFNGEEIEDDLLATITEQGTVSILNEHYEGTFMQTTKNFCFFLYVYWGVNHLRERISVVGGTTEDFDYLNVTITVSLAIDTVIIEPKDYFFVGLSVTFVIDFVIVFLYVRIFKKEQRR
jgi:hypothetical protein